MRVVRARSAGTRGRRRRRPPRRPARARRGRRGARRPPRSRAPPGSRAVSSSQTRSRDLERRAAARRRRGGDELEPALVERRAARRSARGGRGSRARGRGAARRAPSPPSRGAPSRYCASACRRTLARRLGRHDLGARGDLREQVVADERDAARRRRRRACRWRCAPAARRPGARGPPARTTSPSARTSVVAKPRCSGRCAPRTARSPRSRLGGTPCAARRRRPNARLERGALVVARAPGAVAAVAAIAGPGALRDRAGEPGVIEVVVREQDELDRRRASTPTRVRALPRAPRATRRSPGPVSTSVSGSPSSSQTLTRAEVGHARSRSGARRSGRDEAGVDSGHRRCLA